MIRHLGLLYFLCHRIIMKKCFIYDVLCILIERQLGNVRQVCVRANQFGIIIVVRYFTGTVMYYVDPSEGYKRIDRDW